VLLHGIEFVWSELKTQHLFDLAALLLLLERSWPLLLLEIRLTSLLTEELTRLTATVIMELVKNRLRRRKCQCGAGSSMPTRCKTTLHGTCEDEPFALDEAV
jgi:hypothetical protein